MLRDATGYGFIEEFGEYASRSTLSPDNTETLPPPSPPSGRGDVLRIRSPESTRDTFRTVESFFLLAPRAYGASSLAPTQREKFCDSLSRDFHSLGAGTSFFEGAFNCASFPFSSYREAGASLQKKILAVSLNPCQLHLQRSTRTHSKCSRGGFPILVLMFRIFPNRSHILFFDNVFSIMLTLITVIISYVSFRNGKNF